MGFLIKLIFFPIWFPFWLIGKVLEVLGLGLLMWDITSFFGRDR